MDCLDTHLSTDTGGWITIGEMLVSMDPAGAEWFKLRVDSTSGKTRWQFQLSVLHGHHEGIWGRIYFSCYIVSSCCGNDVKINERLWPRLCHKDHSSGLSAWSSLHGTLLPLWYCQFQYPRAFWLVLCFLKSHPRTCSLIWEEGGRGRDRERDMSERNYQLPSCWGSNLQPRLVCALSRKHLRPFWCAGQCSNQLGNTGQDFLVFFIVQCRISAVLRVLLLVHIVQIRVSS